MNKIVSTLALGATLASAASAQVFIDTSFETALPAGFPGTWTPIGLDSIGGAASFNANAFTGFDLAPGSFAAAVAHGSFDFSLRIDTLVTTNATAPGNDVQGIRVMFFSNGTSSNAGFGINADYEVNTDTFTVYARIGSTQSTGISVAPGSLISGSVVFPTATTASLTITNNASVSASVLNNAFTANDAANVNNVEGNRITFRSPNANAGATSAPLIIDDLYAAAAIPEPSSFAALAGFAALGFVASRRRRA